MSDCGFPDGAGIKGGGPLGRSGENEGQNPTSELPPMATDCAYGGDVPDGTNGTDSESWQS